MVDYVGAEMDNGKFCAVSIHDSPKDRQTLKPSGLTTHYCNKGLDVRIFTSKVSWFIMPVDFCQDTVRFSIGELSGHCLPSCHALHCVIMNVFLFNLSGFPLKWMCKVVSYFFRIMVECVIRSH